MFRPDPGDATVLPTSCLLVAIAGAGDPAAAHAPVGGACPEAG